MGMKLFPKAVIAAAFALGCISTSAIALEKREAEAVVSILEKLSAETGENVVFDEEAAQQWLELDEGSLQLIPAAGFTETSWKNAFDQTLTGFVATMPAPDMSDMEQKYADKLDEVGKITPEQKQAALQALRVQLDSVKAIHERGAKYRSVVEPYAARLKVLSDKR